MREIKFTRYRHITAQTVWVHGRNIIKGLKYRMGSWTKCYDSLRSCSFMIKSQKYMHQLLTLYSSVEESIRDKKFLQKKLHSWKYQ